MSNQGKIQYEILKSKAEKGAILSSIAALLDWDQETMMPDKAIEIRSKQQSLIASLAHKERTSPAFVKQLNKLIDLETAEIKHSDLHADQIASVKLFRRDYLKDKRLPPSFVKTFAETTSAATHAWGMAKGHNSFKDFAPHLEKIVKLCRKKADLLGYQHHPYDALLDLYEPEMTTEVLTTLFARLKFQLTNLIKTITSQKQPDTSFLTKFYDTDKQMAFGESLKEAMGFSILNSRLDLSNHPFCSPIHSQDLRMTTRIDPENPISNIFSVIHEGGHGLYAMGRNEAHWGTPLGESCSLGIDESQSRFWETMIGRSLPFWEHFYPLLQKSFPEPLQAIPLTDFHKAINKVHPSLIRVEADEICYGLHVILRFELEKGLIEGSIKVKDIPDIWNAKMVEYLGVEPLHPADGCLQDIHWSLGAFGYFPTYMLGNLYSAQFSEKLIQDYPTLWDDVKLADFEKLTIWLKDNIHTHGRRYSPSELIQKVTGKPLSEEAFIRYVNKKFGNLYNINS